MADENKFLKIKDGVVTGCDYRATKISIPEGVTEIGEGAFESCWSLAEITIPGSVTEIGDGAFAGCTSLASITIPDNVTKISAWALDSCQSLAEITIPDSVTEIGKKAFVSCKSLADIRFGGTVSQWKAVEKGEDWNSGVSAITVHCTDGEMQQTGSVVSGTENEKEPLTIEGGVVTSCNKSATEIAIPEGVTEIGYEAFYGCWALASITIPNSVTKIGECAFEGCQSLAEITIPGSVTEIGDWAFSCCWSLTDIRFGGTVSQWEAVEKVNGPGHASKVHCTDKDVWWM